MRDLAALHRRLGDLEEGPVHRLGALEEGPVRRLGDLEEGPVPPDEPNQSLRKGGAQVTDIATGDIGVAWANLSFPISRI